MSSTPHCYVNCPNTKLIHPHSVLVRWQFSYRQTITSKKVNLKDMIKCLKVHNETSPEMVCHCHNPVSTKLKHDEQEKAFLDLAFFTIIF